MLVGAMFVPVLLVDAEVCVTRNEEEKGAAEYLNPLNGREQFT
jgi:hypothetical protein